MSTSGLSAPHRVRASWHPATPDCGVRDGRHIFAMCSCGQGGTVECADAISDWVGQHHPQAVWYDHRGLPIAGFGSRQ